MSPDGSLNQTLTERQRECLEAVARGLTSKEIARELNLSHKTVDQHIAIAMERLGAKNRTAAAMMLRPQDEIHPGFGTSQASRGDDESVIEPFASADTEAKGFLPPLGGRANALSLRDRLALIVRVALFGLMVTGAAYLSIYGAIRVLGELR